MKQILSFMLFLWIGLSQIISVKEKKQPFPQENRLLRNLLSEEREELSLSVIDDVFSNPDASCQEKIKFIECYLGKIKEFIFTSSRLVVNEVNSLTPKMRTDFVRLRRQLERAQDEMTRIKKIFADLDWMQNFFMRLDTNDTSITIE